MVKAEAEGSEGGEIGKRVGGNGAGEGGGWETESGDAVVLALDAGPGAGGGKIGVPEESAASDGGAEGQEGDPVGREI